MARSASTTFPEWFTSVLVCENCGAEYDEDRDECPDCGCFDAPLIDTGGGPDWFWGYRACARCSSSGRSFSAWASRLVASFAAGTGRSSSPSRSPCGGSSRSAAACTTGTAASGKQLFAHNRGFVTVKDGPAFASELARYLTDSARSPETRQQRRPAADRPATASDATLRRGGRRVRFIVRARRVPGGRQ